MRGRFAPSPTGDMHLGNARTALLAWLHTRLAGGQFVLRLEDLDSGRVRQGAADTILRDLEWLGLDWDEGWDVGGPHAPYVQSERSSLYEAAARRLPTYPCTCTRLEVLSEVLGAASAPHGSPRTAETQGTEPRYPGTCRHGVTHPSRRAALRLITPDRTVYFRDGLMGAVSENPQRSVGDFVIRRNDGAWAYQLAVVVDDAEMQISDVLRGADLLSSAARQLLLYDLLGYPAPRFWHVPLMLDYRGERLAKRHGAPSLRQLREGGASGQAITRDLAQSLGWSVSAPVAPSELLEPFSAWLSGFSV